MEGLESGNIDYSPILTKEYIERDTKNLCAELDMEINQIFDGVHSFRFENIANEIQERYPIMAATLFKIAGDIELGCFSRDSISELYKDPYPGIGGIDRVIEIIKNEGFLGFFYGESMMGLLNDSNIQFNSRLLLQDIGLKLGTLKVQKQQDGTEIIVTNYDYNGKTSD